MSHFSLLVITDKQPSAADLHKIMEPFQEHASTGECPEEFLTFHDEEDEYREKYETESVEMVRTPEGELLSPWDERFRVPGSFGTSFGSNPSHKAPDDYERVQVSHKEQYATFEEYMADYCGYEEKDEKTGRYGYWENENKKWDGGQVGGRWTGFFKAKSDDVDGAVGKPGLMTPHAKKGRLDSVRKGDVDIDGMRDEAGSKAGEDWDTVNAATGGESWESWESVRRRVHGPDDCKYDNTKMDEARRVYNEQSALKAIRADKGASDIASWDADQFIVSREEFIQAARDGAVSTFAVLKDGQWYEKGKMGWWGMVSDKKQQGDWNQEFAALLDGLADDTWLTVIDCHI